MKNTNISQLKQMAQASLTGSQQHQTHLTPKVT